MAAEPVPVRRPGVAVGVEGSDGTLTGGSATGRTKMGFHRKASQRSSTQDAQFETMRSPALGFQFSGTADPRLHEVY